MHILEVNSHKKLMFSLLIDTISNPAHIVIFNEKRDIIDDYLWESRHTEFDTLIEHINILLSQNSINYLDLSALVCIIGPGSFTGIRVTTLVANTLGHSFGITLFPIKLETFFEAQNAPYPWILPLTKSEVIFWESRELSTPSIVKVSTLSNSIHYSTNQKTLPFAQEIQYNHINDYGLFIKKISLLNSVSRLVPIYARDANILIKK